MSLKPQFRSESMTGKLPIRHVAALVVVLVILLVLVFWPSDKDPSELQQTPGFTHQDSAPARAQAPLNIDLSADVDDEELRTARLMDADEDELSAELQLADEVSGKPETIFYGIESGDTLSSIFDKFEIGQTTMYQILAADEQLLALDILRPGNHLTLRNNLDSGQLDVMELYIRPGHQVFYRRVDDENFEYEERIEPGVWQQQVIAGEIHGSFYISARRAGLTDAEIMEVSKLLGEQVDFNRQLRAGDRFQFIREANYVDGEASGLSKIQGIRLQQRNRVYTAFLFEEDGSYYDINGESLTRAFRRLPHNQNFRVSSPFNPRRLHPVTRRVSPHNGTDFAMPTGTPVVSIGDGVVTRVENHPFAGLYLEIQHGSTYKTRYLHMSRIQVKRGETVKRGQRIGLSGATGRVTGPHLHFELHVNGRPVNPMTANLPLARSLEKQQLAKFNQQVNSLVSVMDSAQKELQVARAHELEQQQPGT